jgi:hypothetical protein
MFLTEHNLFGDNGEGEPRVPISNTTVKPFSADGTWTAGSWESRTSPSRLTSLTFYKVRDVFYLNHKYFTSRTSVCIC